MTGVTHKPSESPAAIRAPARHARPPTATTTRRKHVTSLARTVQVLAPLVLGVLLVQGVRGPDPPRATVDALPPRTGTSSTSPSPPTSSRLAVIGDSWSCGEGTDPGSGMAKTDAGFVALAAQDLGWPYEISCIGGTGYTTDEDPYSARAGEVIDHGPDVVLVQGSTNDNHAPGARIEADAEALLGALRTGLPHVRLFVMGPAYSPAVDRALVDVGRAALRTAARHQDATWLDVATAHVLDPSEDFADGVHPDQRGHVLLARWLADELEP